ncbi:zinc metalloprotease [Gaetbulibacter saemankumensis]|uniref:zinc metalloprotease n=1 Tax=Gaetbulibacter saemankumensis TaxID=311208 RepID=UPI0003FC5F8C|nr:zinc metalloprotease [Gaetbulibacter saemankumensis]
MKTSLFKFILLLLVITACNNNDIETAQEPVEIDMSDFYLYTNTDEVSSKQINGKSQINKCYTMSNLNRLLDETPGLETRMYAIEYQTRKFIASKKPSGTPGGGPNTEDPTDPAPSVPYDGIVTIPVIINIIEQYDQQITQAHIDSQIEILNTDFSNNNTHLSSVPDEFATLSADFQIKFEFAGIQRKTSNKNSWGTRDAMKSSKKGGFDPIDPANNLNIWVCEIGGGILGYAQFPGGPSKTDGIVIGLDYFGENLDGKEYGHGRTATHEVGHWLNLRHIWGDGGCSYDDFIEDTPRADGPNYGCPGEVYSCNNTVRDMTMNYMDYVYDNCMYMFTEGQNLRSRALFASDGARRSFID